MFQQLEGHHNKPLLQLTPPKALATPEKCVLLKSIVSQHEIDGNFSPEEFTTTTYLTPLSMQYLLEMSQDCDGEGSSVPNNEEVGLIEAQESEIKLDVSSCFLDSYSKYLSQDSDLRTISEERMLTEESGMKQQILAKERKLILHNSNIMQAIGAKNAQSKPKMVVLGKITDSVVVMDRSNTAKLQTEPINVSQIIVSGEPALTQSHFVAVDTSISQSGTSRPSVMRPNPPNRVTEPSPYHQDLKQSQQRNLHKDRNLSAKQELKLSKSSPSQSRNPLGKPQNQKQADNVLLFEDYNIPKNMHNPFMESKCPPSSSSRKGNRLNSKVQKKQTRNHKNTDNALLPNGNVKSSTESTSNIEEKLRNGPKDNKRAERQRKETPYDTKIQEQIILKLSELEQYVNNMRKDVQEQKIANKSGSRSKGYYNLGQNANLFGSGRDFCQKIYDDDRDISSDSDDSNIRQIKSIGIDQRSASRRPTKVQRAYSSKNRKFCNPNAKTVKEIDQDEKYVTLNKLRRIKSSQEDQFKSSKGFRKTERIISIYNNDELTQELKLVKSIDMQVFDYGPKEGDIRQSILEKIFVALKTIKILRHDVRSLPDSRLKMRNGCVQFRVNSTTKDVLLWYFSGRFYYGGWQQMSGQKGQKNGEGIDIVPYNYIYKGSFKDNQRSGQGVAIFPSKKSYQTYKGSWRNDCFDGMGVFKTLESAYKGYFKEGMKHGTGHQYFQDGDQYRGDYRDNFFHGQGCYKWKNGAIYNGDFKYGLKHGEGVWTSATGDVFSGQYSKSKRHGYGIYKWKDGNIYQGYFSRGVRCDDRKNRQIEEERELSQNISAEESIDVSSSMERYDNEQLPNGKEHRKGKQFQ